VTEYLASKMNLAEDKDKLTLGFSVMQVVISPQSLLETGIIVEKVDDLRLFKFTDDLQDKLEGLLEKNQVAMLTAIEREELESISELDRIFTYLNSLLAAQK
jgi:hypothetical protein